MRTYFLIILMLLSFSAYAGIYKWVDDKGDVHYSDKGQKGAKEVKLPVAVTYTPTNTGSAASGKGKREKQQGYVEMSIVQPKMNETINSNKGEVAVRIALKPTLASGDTITLALDGRAVIKGSLKTSVTLTNIDRGSHTLRATVFDQDGTAIISSKSIIFHLQKKVASKEESGKDNSESFTPDFKNSGTTSETADYNKNYKNNFGKDFGSSGTYQDKAKDFNTGVPAASGTFSPGSTYSPNYNQKK